MCATTPLRWVCSAWLMTALLALAEEPKPPALTAEQRELLPVLAEVGPELPEPPPPLPSPARYTWLVGSALFVMVTAAILTWRRRRAASAG